MVVEAKGYNVAKVVISPKLTAGSTTNVGNKKEYEKLRDMVASSGLMRVVATLTVGGTDMDFDGICMANLYGSGIEFSTIVWIGDQTTPKIVGGQLYIESNTLKCAINYCPVTVSNLQAKSSKSKVE